MSGKQEDCFKVCIRSLEQRNQLTNPCVTVQKTLERLNQRGSQFRNTHKLRNWKWDKSSYLKLRPSSPSPYPIPKMLAVRLIPSGRRLKDPFWENNLQKTPTNTCGGSSSNNNKSQLTTLLIRLKPRQQLPPSVYIDNALHLILIAKDQQPLEESLQYEQKD